MSLSPTLVRNEKESRTLYKNKDS